VGTRAVGACFHSYKSMFSISFRKHRDEKKENSLLTLMIKVSVLPLSIMSRKHFEHDEAFRSDVVTTILKSPCARLLKHKSNKIARCCVFTFLRRRVDRNHLTQFQNETSNLKFVRRTGSEGLNEWYMCVFTNTAVLRKVVQQNRTRQCRKILWVMTVHGSLLWL